jgi:hypothetical protein
MEYTNITQATKQLGLSTRTLRYYEQIGLIESERADDYAYRVYSECKHEGDNPEDYVTEKLQNFIRDTDLLKVNPDIRCFGYNIDVTAGNFGFPL